MATVLNNTSQGTSSGAAGGNATVSAAGGDAPSELFTTLLVAQIKNQNPLEPADPSEFVGQLTQLSQMEALQKLLAQTTASASMLENLQLMTLGGHVGSELRVASERVTLAGTPVRGGFTLESGSADTAVVLGAGSQRYRIELGTLGAGPVEFDIDPASLGIPAGTYALWVEAESGARPGIDIFGTLNSVRLSASGETALNVANVGEIAATAVTGFNGRNN